MEFNISESYRVHHGIECYCPILNWCLPAISCQAMWYFFHLLPLLCQIFSHFFFLKKNCIFPLAKVVAESQNCNATTGICRPWRISWGARQISISKYVVLNKIMLDRMNTSCKYPKVAKYQRILLVFCFVAYSEAAAMRHHWGPLHVLSQVSFGCWVTWSISSWQKHLRVSSFPKAVLSKKKVFGTWQFVKKLCFGQFYNSKICKIEKLTFSSAFLMRGISERIESIYFAESSGLSCW